MVVCFGELLLRLSPAGRERIVQAESFEARYGGAEANVAAAVAMFGGKSRYVTKVPDSVIGEAAVQSIRRYGVNTDGIVRGGERLGIYYLEKGASYRPSKVQYDRKHSAIAEAERTDFMWDVLLAGADAFFFTGITPAVSDPEILMDALSYCRKNGIRVYCDLNYRAALWTAEDAGRVLDTMMHYVDVCVANEEHVRLLFGIVPDESLNDEDARLTDISKQMTERYHFDKVVLTLRESISSDDNEVAAVLYNHGKLYKSSLYKVHIVDRVGGGDALSAALIYSESPDVENKVIDPSDLEMQIDFACAANALKHSIEGDICIADAGEVKKTMEIARSGGRVRLVR